MVSLNKYIKKEHAIILILWIIVTLLNLNKAFHIDDGFHLEFAQYLNKHPWLPMSAKINWFNNTEMVCYLNQPPMYFYFLALAGELLGYGEIQLHLFQSIFAFLSIFFFYKIARIFSEKNALFLTIIFSLSPAFVVNQNLMIDVPLLSFNLIFFYLLFKPNNKHEHLTCCLAGFILGIGLLTKYSDIPLLLIFLLGLIIQKKYRFLYTILIPILMLGIGNWVVYQQTGVIHIFSRETKDLSLIILWRKTESFFTCLGAITPFAFIFIGGFLKRLPWFKLIYLVGFFTSITILPIVSYYEFISETQSKDILQILFLFNGISLLLVLLCEIKSPRKTDPKINILWLWTTSMACFFCLFAPFMATRHILLILPPILFLGGNYLESINSKLQNMAIFCTAFLGIVLAVSDSNYADIYRKEAIEVKKIIPKNNWILGHWGWQWYTKQLGLRQYNSDSNWVKNGDYLVIPVNVSHQNNTDSAYGVPVEKRVIKSRVRMFFSTAQEASFYSCSYPKLPWFFSKRAIDTIKIMKIVNKPEIK